MTEVRCARPPDSAALDGEALHDRLASSFEVSVSKPRVVRHTALDTFDRWADARIGDPDWSALEAEFAARSWTCTSSPTWSGSSPACRCHRAPSPFGPVTGT